MSRGHSASLDGLPRGRTVQFENTEKETPMTPTARTPSAAPRRGLRSAVLLAVSAACSSSSCSGVSPAPTLHADTDARATREHVQSQLMAFSGRFMALVLQASTVFQEAEMRETLELGVQVATLLNETMINTDRMVQRVQDDETHRPFDILEYQAALVQATATLQELQTTLASVEGVLESRGLERQMPQIKEGANWLEEEVATDFLNAAFVRGVALIGVFFVSLFLYRIATRRS